MKQRIARALTLACLVSVLAACGAATTATDIPPSLEPSLLTEAPTRVSEPPTRTPAADVPPPTAQAAAESEGARAPATELHLTIVYDNTAFDSILTPDWGFAAWIEYEGHTLLFDTGAQGSILLDNLAKLGLDPQLIEFVVLSHSHGDHTGGLQGLLDTGITPVVYVPAALAQTYKEGVRAQSELVEVGDPVEILPGLHSTGQLLRNVAEQGLVVETAEGTVVITGCAHPGILRIVERAREIVDAEISLVVGGFHMVEYTRQQIEDTITGFRELAVQQVAPTHCTGELAQAMFREAYGASYAEGGAGRTFVIGAALQPGAASEAAPADTGFVLAGVGFATPESILYDPESDLYLVSNINGRPGDQDGNGFISQVSAQGELIELKWIDGQAAEVTLNGPTGLALAGESLFAADGTRVRIFDRDTGAPLGEVAIPGAVFLNDVAATREGILYVTDSSGGAIYRVTPDGAVTRFAPGVALAGPNGIQVKDDSILVATYDARWVYQLDLDGQVAAAWELPDGGLDGLIWLDDGRILVSSWSGTSIYGIDNDGRVTTLFSPVTAPADIGFDPVRQRVLIPRFQDNQVEARPLP